MLLSLALLSGCASSTSLSTPAEADPWDEGYATHPQDPYEHWNRRVFAFNEQFDTYLFKPTAEFYRWALPDFAQRGVKNFFSNLREPAHLTNNLLQGKPSAAGRDTSRFLINSTLGLAGFLDVATPLGLNPSIEDFGQTLNVWGVPEGPYIVWPFIGGQTLTHSLALPVEYWLNPISHIDDAGQRYATGGLYLVQLRADFIEAESLIRGDRYSFIRDAYLQRRDFLIRDGVLDQDPFLDQDFNFDDF